MAAMLFLARFWPGLRDGSITLTFRSWAKPQARVGSRHRLGSEGALEIVTVSQVAIGQIAEADAIPAGFESRSDLVTALRRVTTRELSDDSLVWRVGLRYVAERDPRLSLGEQSPSAAEVAALLGKLERMDRRGPWTRATLEILDRSPETSARVLAAELGRERAPFKVDVRKLKKQGLTISCEVGSRLSVRGRAVLAALRSG